MLDSQIFDNALVSQILAVMLLFIVYCMGLVVKKLFLRLRNIIKNK